MTDARLIERWLPIAALSEESVRERRSLQALPPTYYLHVWWARRPLIASRAAVLASILPAGTSREKFLHALGIHGDPVATRTEIDKARKTGADLGLDPYGYRRAFTYVPTSDDKQWIGNGLTERDLASVVVLDPTAGGGSIPFEAERLGLHTIANDLNPVAALILKATLESPIHHGNAVLAEYSRLSSEFLERVTPKFDGVFPKEAADERITGYLWTRTVKCPYCDGVTPLSPNWKLSPGGVGVRLKPQLSNGPGKNGRVCNFEIVYSAKEQSPGTVASGDGTCPFTDCGRVIDGEEIKRQAQAGEMGDQLFAVVFKRRVETKTKSGGRGKDKWVREYRAPLPKDDNGGHIIQKLLERAAGWEAQNILPSEKIPIGLKTTEPIRYGMTYWRDLFSPRQLLGHGLGVETFLELLSAERLKGELSPATQAAFLYLSISLDKMLNWNARLASWNVQLQGMRSVFDRHDFAFKWSYAEMPFAVVGDGYKWVIGQTQKCIQELIELTRPDANSSNDLLTLTRDAFAPPPITVSCKSGDNLDHLLNGSVDVVVMDPPYYDNVMYAELSDFFYVWLRRTAGHVFPELFTRQLTDKDNEAVANPAKYAGEKGAKLLAGRDYQERMARIFTECKRVLKTDGVMTLMFTHKATGAWDALTTGLMHAGFSISASWPINTEAEGSLHIKDKSAANSTIFLVCRPRVSTVSDGSADYWEDVEPLVAKAVRKRVKEFQDAGIGGVDLYLACFGPALEEFSRHWPLKRGTPRARPEQVRRRRQAELFEEEWDPYAVSPEDALDAARREVKNWRLEQLTHMKANTEVDPLTAWFVLAWDAFKAPVFPYDEALRLARAVGVDLDSQVVGVLAEKDGSDLLMWDSAMRAAKGSLGSPDGSRAMIDAVHHAAHFGRTRTLQAAKEMLTKAGVDKEPAFFSALEAVLEVLPVSKAFSGIDLEGDVASAGGDFEALENLRKLAFSKQVDQPKQLDLWKDAAPA